MIDPLTMTPAELDAAIGKALGFAREFKCPQCGGSYFGTPDIARTEIKACHDQHEERCRYVGPWEECSVYPPVSTDIADAWTVVEEMQERDFYGWVRTPMRGHFALEGETFMAGFAANSELSLMPPTNPMFAFAATAATAPLAICRAALLALEGSGTDGNG